MPASRSRSSGRRGPESPTLLHIAGLLETPDAGHVFINGRDCSKLDDHGRTRVRRAEIGFIYQFHQLRPSSPRRKTSCCRR